MGQFDALSFPKEYPQHDVAEHEVLMAFNNDADAISFREWWSRGGAVMFGAWLEEMQAEEGRS